MNASLPVDFQSFVMAERGQVLTDSRKVAKAFKKQHRNVLRSIRDLLAKTGKWGLLNFEHTPSLDAQNGQPYDCYRMTKDGFMLLVMGFSGETALRVKVAFIEAFNAMAEIVGRGLYSQRLALEARDAGSKVRASYGSHLMLDRKRELPQIHSERQRLDALMNPPLFLN